MVREVTPGNTTPINEGTEKSTSPSVGSPEGCDLGSVVKDTCQGPSTGEWVGIPEPGREHDGIYFQGAHSVYHPVDNQESFCFHHLNFYFPKWSEFCLLSAVDSREFIAWNSSGRTFSLLN